MHRQPARLRQRNGCRRQICRTQPATERIVDTVAARIDARGFGYLLRIHRPGNFERQTQRQHVRDFLLALLIPAQLRNATPVVVKRHRQGIIQAPGKGKGYREKLAQRRIVSA